MLLWSPLLESRRLLLPPCPRPTRPVCHKREQGHVGSLGFLSRYLFSLSSGGQKFKISVSRAATLSRRESPSLPPASGGSGPPLSSASGFTRPLPVCLSLIFLCLPLRRKPVAGFGARPQSGWISSRVLHRSAETLFQTRPRSRDPGAPPRRPQSSPLHRQLGPAVLPCRCRFPVSSVAWKRTCVTTAVPKALHVTLAR